MAFTPINTEEEFTAAIQERLTRERAKFADYDDLKDRAQKYDDLIAQKWEEKAKSYEADLAKAQQAKADADEARTKEKTRADKAEQALTRYKVAAKHKLPSDLADRIKGDTEADMDKDAETLAKYLGTATTPPRFKTDPRSDPNDKEAAKRAALKGLLDSINQ